MLSMNAIGILMLLLAVACVLQCAAIVHITIKSDRRFKELEEHLRLQGAQKAPSTFGGELGDRGAC